MKKVAVLIYNQYCNFEISVALEMLAMAEKPFVIIARTMNPVCSEEGLTVLPKMTIDEVDINDFDSLLLPGALDISEIIKDVKVLNFIKSFHENELIIGAISISPVLLLKSGVLKNKKFMAGVNREELLEEGFSPEDLKNMISWYDNLINPIQAGYIQAGNIITSVSYNFIKWAMAIGRAIGIEVYPKSFGLE